MLLVLAISIAAGCAAPAAPPATPAAPAADAPADVNALSAARQAFMSGYEAGDAEAIGKLYAEDAVSESNNQASLKGRDAVVASLKGMFQQVSVKTVLTAEETRTLGTVGVDRGRYTVTVSPKAGSDPYSHEGRYMVIYVKGQDGQWRVWRDMDNGVTVPPPAAAAAPAAPAASK